MGLNGVQSLEVGSFGSFRKLAHFHTSTPATMRVQGVWKQKVWKLPTSMPETRMNTGDGSWKLLYPYGARCAASKRRTPAPQNEEDFDWSVEHQEALEWTRRMNTDWSRFPLPPSEEEE